VHKVAVSLGAITDSTRSWQSHEFSSINQVSSAALDEMLDTAMCSSSFECESDGEPENADVVPSIVVVASASSSQSLRSEEPRAKRALDVEVGYAASPLPCERLARPSIDTALRLPPGMIDDSHQRADDDTPHLVGPARTLGGATPRDRWQHIRRSQSEPRAACARHASGSLLGTLASVCAHWRGTGRRSRLALADDGRGIDRGVQQRNPFVGMDSQQRSGGPASSA